MYKRQGGILTMKAKSGLDIFNSILAVALVVVIVVLALVMGVFKRCV